MNRYQKLSDQFYSLNLHTGKTNFKQGRGILCFFIVEHPCSEAFIQAEALQLLMTPCREFHFYGAYSKHWDIGFDLVDIMLHPGDNEDFALTSQWENFDDFVDALELAVTSRYIVLYDVYLIYDDATVYRRVLDRLKEYDSIKRYYPNW